MFDLLSDVFNPLEFFFKSIESSVKGCLIFRLNYVQSLKLLSSEGIFSLTFVVFQYNVKLCHFQWTSIKNIIIKACYIVMTYLICLSVEGDKDFSSRYKGYLS